MTSALVVGDPVAAVILDAPLTWRMVAAVADGAPLLGSDAATARIDAARALVDTIVVRSIRAYGVNTGVGALCDVIVDRDHQQSLSKNIVMSHAVGVGAPLGKAETRAIMAAAVNNWAHGYSGVRIDVVDTLLALLAADCIPLVPSRGSVGYISHMAHIGLVLIGEGFAICGAETLTGAMALSRAGRTPLVLDAKEGLSVVNGTPCATGLAALALARVERLLDWADASAALSFEALAGDPACFAEDSMALHASPGLRVVAARLRHVLAGSCAIAATGAGRTQEALSLRAVPQVHGAARDALVYVAGVVDRELASPTDNPLLLGPPDRPRAASTAHAVGAGVGLAMDLLGILTAEVAAMAERRIDRLVNPLVSGLPAFLAAEGGSRSGFMIAQYTAASLVAENRRLAAPASLDGGVTSALQEDHLAHATPASLKALQIIDNAASILAIEVLAAIQATDPVAPRRSPVSAAIAARLRAVVPPYADDRPLGQDFGLAAAMMARSAPF